MGRQWRDASLDDNAWRPLPGLTREARAAEQDRAAGGHDKRRVAGDPQAALASIYFRRAAGRRVYAYLRWAESGHTSERFVCEVDHPTRVENLVHAWNVARDRQLVVDRRDASQVLPVGHTPSWASSDIVRRQMQANRSRDTKPELALRSRVHELGLRYRVATKPLPSSRRTADLVFTRARVAVFLDGCFWHGCPDHHRPARRNEEFWREKIVQNRERDEQTTELLQQAGWLVVRVWEHEDPVPAALRIHEIVSMRRRDATKDGESTLSRPEFPNPGSARSARSLLTP
jgi:DNA mismatch endonuclease (patch repair protein)